MQALQTERTVRDWFADHVGVSPERKADLYVELSCAVTVRDATYWLQILFAAGIATLGLVLNSPAVIIGAMLISPLMGPILAGGLSLASGDLILGIRALINLALSCLLAVTLAVVLVGLLPFREMTNEIASRTRPTTLDLVVALFSGAIGSLAICKEMKGVITSIPGVAIAVALMPPLCVVGYGLGVSLSLSAADGMRIAGGGGLLFLTNLVAITFTAMIVFLALHIDVPQVRARIEQWRSQDRETNTIRNLMKRFRFPEGMRAIGGLPGRFILILVPILLILIPLAQSFNQLKQEIAAQQHENRVRQAAVTLWQQDFARMADGEPRSSIDQLSVLQQDGRLTLQLRVFTSKPLTVTEKSDYERLVAARLNIPSDSIRLQLIEIPTAAGAIAARAREDGRQTAPTLTALGAGLAAALDAALRGLILPPPAQLVDYQTVLSSTGPIEIRIIYLSDREIDADGEALLAEEVRSRLAVPSTKVSLLRIESTLQPVLFGRNQVALTAGSESLLESACVLLDRHKSLQIEITAGAERGEREGIAAARAAAVIQALSSKCPIAPERVAVMPDERADRSVSLRLVAEAAR